MRDQGQEIVKNNRICSIGDGKFNYEYFDSKISTIDIETKCCSFTTYFD